MDQASPGKMPPEKTARLVLENIIFKRRLDLIHDAMTNDILTNEEALKTISEILHGDWDHKVQAVSSE